MNTLTKQFLLAASCAVVFSPALAVEPLRDPWNGFYAGAMAAHARGENDWKGIGDYRLDSRTLGGVFAGYNHRAGAAVIGVEISGIFGNLPERDDKEYRYRELQDARIRLGHASGQWLAYVAGGYSRARFDDEGLRFTMKGYNVGVGVELAISERMRLGLDYTTRRFDNQKCPHGTRVDGRVDTAALRLGWRF